MLCDMWQAGKICRVFACFVSYEVATSLFPLKLSSLCGEQVCTSVVSLSYSDDFFRMNSRFAET